jgi:quercetin dioxygenase-like cupin family protein
MYGIDLADSRRAISISVIQSASAPWVLDPATGGTYSLLQVDRLFGVWVVRSRLEPNTIVQRHLHSGPVAALTLAGHWGYPESGWACGPGDYLVENSGTIHSLAVLGNKGPTAVLVGGFRPSRVDATGTSRIGGTAVGDDLERFPTSFRPPGRRAGFRVAHDRGHGIRLGRV